MGAVSERYLRTHPRRRFAAALLTAYLLVLALAGCTVATVPSPNSSEPATSTVPLAITPAASQPSPSDTPTSTPPIPPATPATLVKSATWVTRAGVRSLRVVPTDAARAAGVDGDAVWAAVVAVRPDADRPGMRDQLVCHVSSAPGKAAWYLEPARPAVGYAETVAAACNPGDVADPG